MVIRLDPTTEPRLGRRKIVIPSWIVETGGRTLLPPPKSSGLDEHEDFSLASVGDNGNAIGPYQIWRSYWKDAVQFDKSIGGKYEDCFNREYSEKIVNAYMDRYAIERRLGRTVTMEDIARIHNGGPNGYRKKATQSYWEKVLNIMKID